MSKRIRLTKRGRKAVDGTIPYPGNVNQAERQFKEHAQYDNWQEVINHPLPDMRHEWKREHTPEGRDEIGFGIPEDWETQPTLASIHCAANKSVRAAILLLGEKVAEEVIEEQARDFMLMGGEALDRTIARFTATEDIYKIAEDDDDDDDDDDDEGDEGEGKEASTDNHYLASTDADVQAKIAELKVEEEARTANLEDYNQKVLEAAKKSIAGDSEVERVAGPNEMDIELEASMDSEVSDDPQADAILAGLFDDGTADAELLALEQGREASAKQGINSLGGQPKVASANSGAVADISSIWESAPDVSEIFN